MKQLKTFIVIFLLSAPIFLNAQTETDQIKATIMKMFDGMRKGDSAMVHSVFYETAQMQTLSEDRNGVIQLTNGSLSNFIKAVGTPHAEVWDERIEFGAIKIDGPLASVWTPYEFYRGDQFSHCGVNSFQLAKKDKDWKIIYIVDTRRKDNCK